MIITTQLKKAIENDRPETDYEITLGSSPLITA
jgi:hypothetical protein